MAGGNTGLVADDSIMKYCSDCIKALNHEPSYEPWLKSLIQSLVAPLRGTLCNPHMSQSQGALAMAPMGVSKNRGA